MRDEGSEPRSSGEGHGEGAGYEVEFITLTGRTVAVATLLPSQLRPVSPRDLSHVRELAAP